MTHSSGTPCQNLNHRRSDAPVRYCPQCGKMVNSAHPVAACPEDRHTAARRQQSTFCVHCGVRLIGMGPRIDNGRISGVADGDDRWRY
jgi:hypothetical protein